MFKKSLAFFVLATASFCGVQAEEASHSNDKSIDLFVCGENKNDQLSEAVTCGPNRGRKGKNKNVEQQQPVESVACDEHKDQQHAATLACTNCKKKSHAETPVDNSKILACKDC